MTEMICIACPMGCHLTVTEAPDGWTVTGNRCPRGMTYGIQEMTDPRRVVTSTIRVRNGSKRMVSVKVSAPIPKGEIFHLMAELRGLQATAPIRIGDVLVPDILGLGVDLVATAPVNLSETDPDSKGQSPRDPEQSLR